MQSNKAKKGLMMLTKTQVEGTIAALQSALREPVQSILSAYQAQGVTGMGNGHRIMSAAPGLTYLLSSLTQMQALLLEFEAAESEFEARREEVSTLEEAATLEAEHPFARRMRLAREAKAAEQAA